MADLFARDTGIVLLIAGFAILIALPVQLVLCIKAKKLFYKCLPTTVLAVLVITFYIMAITAKTWVAFAYLIIAVFFRGIAHFQRHYIRNLGNYQIC